MDALFCPDAGGSARKSALPLVWGNFSMSLSLQTALKA
jgi:hypothetical protein